MKRSGRMRRLTEGLAGSAHTRGFVLWVAALVTGILCVWQHVYAIHLAAHIEEQRIVKEELETQIGFLRVECAELSSRERIETIAVEELGMRHPRSKEIVRLGAERESPEAYERDEFVGRGDDGQTDS